MRRGWHPAIQRGDGYAEVLGHVLGWNAASQQLLGRLDLAVGHLELTAALATELPCLFGRTGQALIEAKLFFIS